MCDSVIKSDGMTLPLITHLTYGPNYLITQLLNYCIFSGPPAPAADSAAMEMEEPVMASVMGWALVRETGRLA
jgi:hypothetical protein